nr:unnamed protein product [Callosobruchus analis]
MKFCSLLLVALVLVAVSQVQAQGHVKLADKNSPNLVDLEDQQGITGKPEPGKNSTHTEKNLTENNDTGAL